MLKPGAESVKAGTYTPSEKVVEFVTLPDVPVSVTVDCPMAAELLAVSVSVLFPVVGFGVKDAVTPAGKPDNERLTLPVNPYWGLMET
jgi:hypothetical protein